MRFVVLLKHKSIPLFRNCHSLYIARVQQRVTSAVLDGDN